jgi:hypothetical protein
MARLVIRLFMILSIMSGMPSQTFATSQREWDSINSELSRIPSASGDSVHNRIKRCRIKIQRDGSFIEKLIAPLSQFDAAVGDTILQIIIDTPPFPGRDPSLSKDLTARWIIRNGSAEPNSGWARTLQNSPPPIGSAVWMNC